MNHDVRIAVGLRNHHKTKKLHRRLGADGVLALVWLLLWAGQNRPDGDLTGMSDEDIELAVDWSGGEGALVSALQEVRFLDGEPGARRIHDWTDHNPWAAGAEARSEKSRWAALCKQRGRAEAARLMPEYAKRIGAASQVDASGTPDALPESANGTRLADSGSAPSPSPLPSPSPDQEQSSLRSDSSSAGAEDPQQSAEDARKTRSALRLRQVTQEAIDAYNARLAKPEGLLPGVRLLTEERLRQVKRCLPVATQIAERTTGSTTITPEFWADYFDAVAQDDFWSGRKPGGRGHENWTPNFDSLTQPDVLVRIYERAEQDAPMAGAA
jgi:hypothetical protein